MVRYRTIGVRYRKFLEVARSELNKILTERKIMVVVLFKPVIYVIDVVHVARIEENAPTRRLFEKEVSGRRRTKSRIDVKN